MTTILFGTVLIVLVVLALTALVMTVRGVVMPSHPAVLTVNGNTTFDVQTGQTLLNALHAHDVLVPSACAGKGTCGLCRVTVLDEDQTYRPTEIAHIDHAERRKGVHLACQVTLHHDMQVEAPQEWVGATTYTTTVHSVTALTPLIREVVLQLPEEVDAQIVARLLCAGHRPTLHA
jgi:Na+-transporting NADH:ubiquinone oxidoreductase subunit F